MSGKGGLGPARAVILAGGAVLALGAGYLVWQGRPPAVTPDPTVNDPVATAAAQVAAPLPAPDPAALSAPRIDTWRVDPAGQALVAGIAAPDAVVEVVVDGARVATGTADPSGQFALLFTLPPRDRPGLMWLSATIGGRTVASQEMVALGPVPGPTSDPAAAAAPVPLLLTGEGPVPLQTGPAPDAALAANVTIDTIAYLPGGAVQIGGWGAPGAGLRLYLDNRGDAGGTVPPDGRWLVTLGDAAPGIYTLRVDQMDRTGKVTSRFETPFRREAVEGLAAVSAPPPSGAAPSADPAAGPVARPPAPASPAAPAADTPAQAEAAPMISVTVQPGFTLWSIAQDRYGDGVMYVQVFQANRDKIRNPDLIYPGQVFTVPVGTAGP